MKRFKYLLIGLLAAAPVFGIAAGAHAQSFRSGNVTVPVGQTVNETLFVGGDVIDIAGTVNGDVFCGGQNVTISGTVNGDVICGGQNVLITGKVNGDVRVAGQDVSVSGPIAGNLTAVGQTVTTHTQGSVKGDVSIGSQNVVINGPVGRDLAVGGNTAMVNASVGRNVVSSGEKLSLGNEAKIAGNVHYTSHNNLARDHAATVQGTIVHSQPKEGGTHVRPGAFFGVGLLMALYLFLSLLLVALVLVLLMPRIFHDSSELARQHLLRTFLVGLVASIVVPVVLVALLLTVIGIPLAIFLGLVWMVIVLFSGPFAAYLLGRMLFHNSTQSAIWTMLGGAAILLLLGLVPILGVFTSLVAFWFGVGTILQALVRGPRPSYRIEK
jgi:hypothetical protein